MLEPWTLTIWNKLNILICSAMSKQYEAKINCQQKTKWRQNVARDLRICWGVKFSIYFGKRPLGLALPHTAQSASTISRRPLMIRAETNREKLWNTANLKFGAIIVRSAQVDLGLKHLIINNMKKFKKKSTQTKFKKENGEKY